MGSDYGRIFWFLYGYNQNLRLPKNTEGCLEKFLPSQDEREHDSWGTLLIPGLETLYFSSKVFYTDKTNSQHIILQMYYCSCCDVGRNTLHVRHIQLMEIRKLNELKTRKWKCCNKFIWIRIVENAGLGAQELQNDRNLPSAFIKCHIWGLVLACMTQALHQVLC